MEKIRVYRAPGGSDGIITHQDGHEGSILPGYPSSLFEGLEGGVTIQFLAGTKSKRSKFWAWFAPDKFQAIANAMIAGSPKAARRAFLMAMLKDLDRDA